MRLILIESSGEFLLKWRLPLIVEFLERGIEVVVCVPDEDQALERKLKAIGVCLHVVRFDRTTMNPLSDLAFCIRLMRLYGCIRPDAVISFTVKPVLYGSITARLARVPNIYCAITGLGYVFGRESAMQRLLNVVLHPVYRLALHANRRIFFQNQDDLSLCIERKLLREREKAVVVSGSGVDIEYFHEVPPITQPIVFLLMARLLIEKGIREYVEAAKALRAKYRDTQFQLLGPYDSNPTAITKTEIENWHQDGAIKYLGQAYDVRPHLAAASVCVLPSYREGMPHSVLEAMAMGKPIVTTDAPGCRETVIDGANGFLVPVRDARALERAMERLILNPTLIPEMGKRSRELAVQKFDVRSVNRVIVDTVLGSEDDV